MQASQSLIIANIHQIAPSAAALKVTSMLPILLPLLIPTLLFQSPVAATPQKPPSPQLERLVIEAFTRSHDGWSVDEVLLDDARRSRFLDACKSSSLVEHVPETEERADQFCAALLHVRKRGGLLPKASRRAAPTEDLEAVSQDSLEAIAEIAARRLQDETGQHSDALLVSEDAREKFDQIAQRIAPNSSSYLLRKAALRLRKTRKLEPELLARVTDWKHEIFDFQLQQLASDLVQIPERPGVYVFRDTTGYLYIGQAANLRERLTSHLKGSDRKALAGYLATDSNADDVTVELHVFGEGSPGEKLQIRRAYESELIRTRSPRLNVSP